MTDKSMEAAFVAAMKDNPAKYTTAWWGRQLSDTRKEVIGLSRIVSILANDHQELLGQVASLEKERAEADAAIGELEARVQGMAEFVQNGGK